MARHLDVDALINSVITRAMIPDTQRTFKEEHYLMFANEEMDNAVVPFIHSFRQDYLLITEEINLESGVSRYRIPSRAVASKLRDVALVDNSGSLFEMTRIFIEDEPYFQASSYGAGFNSLRSYTTENDEIVFANGVIPSGQDKLRMAYYIRPNQLVSKTRVATITNINTTTNVVTIDHLPEVFSGATTFDITSSSSPFTLLAMNIAPTVLATSTSLQFTFDVLPRYLSVGDIIALPEETSIPQIPVEVHSLLAQRVAMRCLEALGDTQGLQNAAAKAAEMEDKLSGVLMQRVEGSPFKVNNFHSNLKKSRRWTWGG